MHINSYYHQVLPRARRLVWRVTATVSILLRFDSLRTVDESHVNAWVVSPQPESRHLLPTLVDASDKVAQAFSDAKQLPRGRVSHVKLLAPILEGPARK